MYNRGFLLGLVSTLSGNKDTFYCFSDLQIAFTYDVIHIHLTLLREKVLRALSGLSWSFVQLTKVNLYKKMQFQTLNNVHMNKQNKENLPRKIEHSEEDNKWKQSVHRWCPLATTSSTTSTASRHGHDGRQHHGPVRCATTHFEAFIWQRWAVVNFSSCERDFVKTFQRIVNNLKNCW